jgi:hypothetical protein
MSVNNLVIAKKRLYNLAVEMYGEITPCCSAGGNWDKCYTIVNGKLIFWFNCEDNSTRVTKEVIEN